MQLTKFKPYYNPCTAVKLDLEMMPLVYTKWGGTQVAKAGDWVVNKNGETYTVNGESFAKTYREISAGVYVKIVNVYAMRATDPGYINTKEGQSQFKKGDWLVYNSPNGTDGYCIANDKFIAMYIEDLD